MDKKIVIYTDGAAINNGSDDARCGWAILLSYDGREKTKSGYAYGRTNNYMEMWAVLEALKSISDKTIPVELFSDSQYVIRTLNKDFRVGTNEDLWREIFYEVDKFCDIKFQWVKGHSGIRGNEIVNDIAETEARNV